MRDEERIDRILNKIKTAWKKNPDMRLGQLLINLCIIPDDYTTWSMEDGDIEEYIDKDVNRLYKKEGKK